MLKADGISTSSDTSIEVPCQYKTLDVIIGPVSRDQHRARRMGRVPEPQESVVQMNSASYRACEVLGRALVAVIYIDITGD